MKLVSKALTTVLNAINEIEVIRTEQFFKFYWKNTYIRSVYQANVKSIKLHRAFLLLCTK